MVNRKLFTCQSQITLSGLVCYLLTFVYICFDMHRFLYFVFYILFPLFIMNNVVFHYPSFHSQFPRLSQFLFLVSPFSSTFQELLITSTCICFVCIIIVHCYVTFSPFLLVCLYCQPPTILVMLFIQYQYGSNG